MIIALKHAKVTRKNVQSNQKNVLGAVIAMMDMFYITESVSVIKNVPKRTLTMNKLSCIECFGNRIMLKMFLLRIKWTIESKNICFNLCFIKNFISADLEYMLEWLINSVFLECIINVGQHLFFFLSLFFYSSLQSISKLVCLQKRFNKNIVIILLCSSVLLNQNLKCNCGL